MKVFNLQMRLIYNEKESTDWITIGLFKYENGAKGAMKRCKQADKDMKYSFKTIYRITPWYISEEEN